MNDTVPALSASVRQALVLVARGLTQDEVAAAMGMSRSAVKTRIEHAIDVLVARGRTHAICLALRYGIITLDEVFPDE